MHDREYDELLAINQVKHPVRKLAQQSPPGAGFGIDDNLLSRLGFDAGKRDANGEQESFGCLTAACAIPSRRFRDIRLGLCREQDGHIPSCLRISASATAQDTTAPGFCR